MRGIFDVEVQADLADAGEGLEGFHGLLVDEAGDVGVVRGDGDVDGDVVFFIDADGFDEAEGDDVAAEAGVADGGEGGADVGFGRHGGRKEVTLCGACEG